MIKGIDSHRKQHREAAVQLKALAAEEGREPTGAEYARVRRIIAAQRREWFANYRAALKIGQLRKRAELRELFMRVHYSEFYRQLETDH
jgi:hypothetical protein